MSLYESCPLEILAADAGLTFPTTHTVFSDWIRHSKSHQVTTAEVTSIEWWKETAGLWKHEYVVVAIRIPAETSSAHAPPSFVRFERSAQRNIILGHFSLGGSGSASDLQETATISGSHERLITEKSHRMAWLLRVDALEAEGPSLICLSELIRFITQHARLYTLPHLNCYFFARELILRMSEAFTWGVDISDPIPSPLGYNFETRSRNSFIGVVPLVHSDVAKFCAYQENKQLRINVPGVLETFRDWLSDVIMTVFVVGIIVTWVMLGIFVPFGILIGTPLVFSFTVVFILTGMIQQYGRSVMRKASSLIYLQFCDYLVTVDMRERDGATKSLVVPSSSIPSYWNVLIWTASGTVITGFHLSANSTLSISSVSRWMGLERKHVLHPVTVAPNKVFPWAMNLALRDAYRMQGRGDFLFQGNYGIFDRWSRSPVIDYVDLSKQFVSRVIPTHPLPSVEPLIPYSIEPWDQAFYQFRYSRFLGRTCTVTRASVTDQNFKNFKIYTCNAYHDKTESCPAGHNLLFRGDIYALFEQFDFGVDIEDEYRIIQFRNFDTLDLSACTHLDIPSDFSKEHLPSDFFQAHFKHCLYLNVANPSNGITRRIELEMYRLGCWDTMLKDADDPRWSGVLGRQIRSLMNSAEAVRDDAVEYYV